LHSQLAFQQTPISHRSTTIPSAPSTFGAEVLFWMHNLHAPDKLKRTSSMAIAFEINLASKLPNPHRRHSQLGSHSPTCNPAQKG
jgi:hypothetical protein